MRTSENLTREVCRTLPLELWKQISDMSNFAQVLFENSTYGTKGVDSLHKII
jgi:hypothetical protein